MTTASSLYGCNFASISSIVNVSCSSLLTGLPTGVLSDAAGCTSQYHFEALQASCASKNAPCVDYASWTLDISSGLSACVAAATGTDTGGAGPTTAATTGSGGHVTATPASTAMVGSSSSTGTGALPTSTNSAGNLKIPVVAGIVGVVALMVLQVGI